MKLKLAGSESQRVGHRGTQSTEAHDLYLRAQEQFYQFTRESMASASDLLAKSIETDPNYAEAYAWLSRVQIFAHISGLNSEIPDATALALASARHAIALDDLLPLAHASLGWALMWNREIDEALIEVNKALSLDPNFADAYLWHSLTMSSAEG